MISRENLLEQQLREKDKEIERLKEELTILVKDDERSQETIINLGKENEELKSIIKTKDEGIKALTEDLCDTTLELEKKDNIINKAIEYLTSTTHFVLEYDKPFRKLSKYEEQYEKREEDLKNILKGEDNE